MYRTLLDNNIYLPELCQEGHLYNYPVMQQFAKLNITGKIVITSLERFMSQSVKDAVKLRENKSNIKLSQEFVKLMNTELTEITILLGHFITLPPWLEASTLNILHQH